MRVSSTDDRQSVDLQRDALIAAGVDSRHLYSDKASGAREDRVRGDIYDGQVPTIMMAGRLADLARLQGGA
tara:strand:+ start:6770 stop:6982 length:213 start_codon:yes stop_codon:yes gene_type:complete